MPAPTSEFVQRTVSRLKFPQAFAIFAALFVFDLIVPDFIPLIDEILLALGAALFGMWRERVTVGPAAPTKPPEKNVTPGT
jgi:hypothetical protein